jgi:hypothetical protein
MAREPEDYIYRVKPDGGPPDSDEWGGACWYCHWGWSAPVVAIYREAVARLEAIGSDGDALLYGSSHIVWEDENFDRYSVQSCIDDPWLDRSTPDEEAVVQWSLRELLKLPDEVRDPEPEAYNGYRPEDFPPAPGVEMARWYE